VNQLEERKRHSEHGDSLKSRKSSDVLKLICVFKKIFFLSERGKYPRLFIHIIMNTAFCNALHSSTNVPQFQMILLYSSSRFYPELPATNFRTREILKSLRHTMSNFVAVCS
jgi:hypothetical protein